MFKVALIVTAADKQGTTDKIPDRPSKYTFIKQRFTQLDDSTPWGHHQSDI